MEQYRTVVGHIEMIDWFDEELKRVVEEEDEE